MKTVPRAAEHRAIPGSVAQYIIGHEAERERYVALRDVLARGAKIRRGEVLGIIGTGFHPELTDRENIYLNGAILGMTRAEVRRKFDEIVAFTKDARGMNGRTPAHKPLRPVENRIATTRQSAQKHAA